jgi:hypothetical protein
VRIECCVGREYQYDNLLKGSDDWRRWAYNLRDFVNDTTHNAEFMNWRLDTPFFIVLRKKIRLVHINICIGVRIQSRLVRLKR